MNLDPEHVVKAAGSDSGPVLESLPQSAPGATNRLATAARPRTIDSLEPGGRELFTRLFWLSSAILFLLIIWKVGPVMIEDYQYSLTRGKVRAEYDNAVEQLASDPLDGVSRAYQLVAQNIRPSVVSIRTLKKVRDIRNGQGRSIEPGQGSGVIMSEEGYLLTNAHVVRGASSIEVTLFDRRVFAAMIVGETDQFNDLAVLKIEASNLIPAQWGDSDELQVGSIVWAIGSPFGLEQTVTSGIVSAKNRYDKNSPQLELLQTDAAVNPGNSGGPLVDSQGRVVGINTSIFGNEFLGISFAVPSVQAKFVYDQTIKNGFVTRGIIGARPAPIFQTDASRFGLPDTNGALLEVVEPNSPAKRSGLRRHDVVRSWNGYPIRDYNQLFRYVSMTEPYSVADVGIIRNGHPKSLKVQVGSRRDYENASLEGR